MSPQLWFLIRISCFTRKGRYNALKILMSAYACCPHAGSEPGSGWNWALQMARWHEVWVITRPKNRQPIEAALTGELRRNLHIAYVDLPGRARWWWRLGKPLGWARYYWWQHCAYREALKLHTQIRFDLAHHVTFASWRAPSFLWRLGIPFIWGPLGGGQEIPQGFGRSLGMRGRMSNVTRAVWQRLSYIDPAVRATRQHAAAVLAGNRETEKLLMRLPGVTPSILPLASYQERTHPRSTLLRKISNHSGCIRLLWVGRIEPWKGLHLLIMALGRLALEKRGLIDFHLDVVNIGPDMDRCRKMAVSLGLADRISFLGHLQSHAEVLELYSQSDVFVFTSLCESLGMVLLEAMDAGLPAICFAHGGPDIIADPDCAIMITPKSAEYVIEKLAEAILALAHRSELRTSMGQSARRRAEENFAWHVLGERMNVIYLRAASEVTTVRSAVTQTPSSNERPL